VTARAIFRRIEYALETAKAGHADIAAFPESAVLGWENPDAHHLAIPTMRVMNLGRFPE
jgi:predicted amidohydrolase